MASRSGTNRHTFGTDDMASPDMSGVRPQTRPERTWRRGSRPRQAIARGRHGAEDAARGQRDDRRDRSAVDEGERERARVGARTEAVRGRSDPDREVEVVQATPGPV